VADADGLVRLWDLRTRKARSLRTNIRDPLSLAFSPDGKELAVGHGGVTFWGLGDKPEVKRTVWLARLTLSAHAVAYSPDGRYLAAVGVEQGLALLDPATGELYGRFFGETKGRQNLVVAFSPDGKTVAAGGANDGEVLLWDAPRPRKPPKK
jgi:WD40 repeat protein